MAAKRTIANANGSGEVFAAPHPFAGLRRRFYRTIVCDPPLKFQSYTAIQSANWSSRRDNERHYAVMSIAELAALPIKELAHPEGAHLFVWCAGPSLVQALGLIETWGFKFSTRALNWVKARRTWDGETPVTEADFPPGLGLTVRHQSELVLLGRYRNCRRLAKDVREVIFAPKREHSRKPDEAFRRIERYSAAPRCELFSRERRPGWDHWGLEVDKFSAPAVSLAVAPAVTESAA